MAFKGIDGLIIGKNINWKDVKDVGFKVESVLPFAKIEGNKIKDVSKSMPFALLKVYNPIINSKHSTLYLPVNHRIDFLHIWEIYNVRGVNRDTEEVICLYTPSESGLFKIFKNVLPCLTLSLHAKGSFEIINSFSEIVNRTQENLNKSRAIAYWYPNDK